MAFDPQSIDREELKQAIEASAAVEETLYTELGRKVYLNEMKEPGAYAEEAEEIKAHKAKVALYDAILNALSAETQVCPSCGGIVLSGVQFCPACGHQLEQKAEADDDGIVCPSCGQKLPAGATFCTECGEKL